MIALMALLLSYSDSLFGSIQDYIFPSQTPSFSNYGTVGLIQMPSARSLSTGTLAFTWTNNEPYLRGSIVAYPFDWLEASYQYTDVNNALYSNISSFSGSQTYKDKSFDAKFLLVNESNYLPSIAVGLRDLAGSGIFSSEYLVASKFINNFDITLGIGWGILNKNKITNPLSSISTRFDKRTYNFDTRGGEFDPGKYFSGNAGLFGGLEYFIPNARGARLKLEYDGTNYGNEGFNPGQGNEQLLFERQQSQASRINFGIVYPFSDLFHAKLSYTKGNTLSLGFNAQLDFGKKEPLIRKNDRYKKIKDANAVVEISGRDNYYLYRSALYFLNEKRLYLQSATVEDDTLSLAYMQGKYLSHIRATGRVAQTLDEIMPSNIKRFKISSINASLGMNTISIDRESFAKYQPDNYYILAKQNIETASYLHNKKDYDFQPTTNYPVHFLKIEPKLRSQIGGPDGFYFGDFRLAINSELMILQNLNLITSASASVLSNFDDLKLASDSILPHVRTDIVSYLKESEKFSLDVLQLNYFSNPREDIYTKLSAGILESMFGGLGGEILFRPFEKNYALGLELWRVRQREYNQRLGFREYRVTTGFMSLYYTEPNTGITAILLGGKFLAGDSGLRLDLSRRFKSGFSVGMFAAKTDISKLEFGEGSFDKGFYFWIPLESLFSKYETGHTGYGLRPVTRDGAAVLQVAHPLFAITEGAQNFNLTRDWDDLYE
jgi:hypothetical protein